MRYAQIPSAVLEDLELSAGALRLYAVLDWIAGKNGWCVPSERTLAEKMGVSDRTIRKYLSQLKALGHISITARMKAVDTPDTNLYVLPHRSTGKNLPHGKTRAKVRNQTSYKPESPLKGDDQRAADAPALEGPSLAPLAKMIDTLRELLSRPSENLLVCLYGSLAELVAGRVCDGTSPIHALDKDSQRGAQTALVNGGLAYLHTESAFNEACKVSGFRERATWIQVGELLPQ